MGGRSKSSSSSTSGSTANSGQLMKEAGKAQQNLQGALLQTAFPAFGEMLKGGMEAMNSNPAMKLFGSAMGLPIQMETPEFMQGFIDKYRPQPEQPQQPAQQFNINDHMRQQMNPNQNMNPYGVNPNMNYGGQYGQGNQGQY
jgi:hypothetical protein